MLKARQRGARREVNGMDSDGNPRRPVQAVGGGEAMPTWTVGP